MIADTVQRIFTDNITHAVRAHAEAGQVPEGIWRVITENGLHLALASADAGGSELTWRDAYPILRGIGYWQVPVPLAETLVAAALLSDAGIDIPEGPMTLIEVGRHDGLHLQRDAQTLILQGRAVNVPWASVARWAVISAHVHEVPATELPRIALIDLAQEGVIVSAGRTVAGEPQGELKFDAVPTTATATYPSTYLSEPVLSLGALARSAMIVGALEAALHESVTYANDRVQFGRPIGKNQAIQQSLAEMAGEVLSARMATEVAFTSMSDSGRAHSRQFDVAVAKVRASESATRVSSIAHQVHGAIGFTHEHALHFATRRLWAWRKDFGSDAFWANRLGHAAIQAGSEGFWPALTDRSLLAQTIAPY